MKLHQLRYLAAVAQTGLNITAAAEKLHTSQPGVSKQIKLLEDELGFQIFVRDGRNLARVTPAGQQVIDRAIRILREVQNIKRLSEELKDEARGTLSIATTHTQARYVLPEVIKQFRDKYPEVGLHLHQGTSEQIARDGRARPDRLRDRHRLAEPVRRVTRCCPAIAGTGTWSCRSDHPLAQVQEAHAQAARGAADRHVRVQLHGTVVAARRSSRREGLVPNVVLTARDADVIKTYVRLGLGVGIVASMAIDEQRGHGSRRRSTRRISFPAHVDVDRLPARRAAAQVPARLHPAVRAAPDAPPDRARRERIHAGRGRRAHGGPGAAAALSAGASRHPAPRGSAADAYLAATSRSAVWLLGPTATGRPAACQVGKPPANR